MLEFFGAAVFVSVGNNLFNSKLTSYIEALDIPDLDAFGIVQNGATTLREMVPAEYLPEVLAAYMRALRWPFRISLILACLSLFGSAGLEWKKFKGNEQKNAATDSGSSDVEKGG